MTVKGSVTGTIIRADRQYAISRQLMAVRAKAWDADFLHHCLSTFVEKFQRLASGLIPGISRSDILNAEAPCPEPAEQQSIAAVLSAAEQEILALNDLLIALRRQKLALMQVSLTGKIRVLAERRQ